MVSLLRHFICIPLAQEPRIDKHNFMGTMIDTVDSDEYNSLQSCKVVLGDWQLKLNIDTILSLLY